MPYHCEMKWFLIAFLAVVCVCANAQTKNYNTENEKWFVGTVHLKNGQSVSGRLNYNFVVDQLKVEDNLGKQKNHGAISVARFELWDSQEKRTFHSLPLSLNEKGKVVNGKSGQAFFQELYRNDKYIVLSKHLFEVDHEKGHYIPTYQPMPNGTVPAKVRSYEAIVEKVVQVIFLADRSRNLTACLQKTVSKERYNNGGWWNLFPRYDQELDQSNTKKVVAKFRQASSNCFKDFFGRDYAKFEKAIKDQDLDKRTLSGLITAMKSMN